ncbi:MAG: alpha/beta hydrolase [Gemmatimonadota bacterium]|nr:alpha/beta hydrolase [Gemmatimonadota bacterium]
MRPSVIPPPPTRATQGKPLRQRYGLPLVALAALTIACSPRRGIEGWVLDDRVVRSADIAYGEGPRQRLDVYRDRMARGPEPVIVFLYGGRWKHGSKRDYVLLGNALARRGWIVVVPDSRLYPEALFPAWVEDAARAVRWSRANVARFGGDSTRIVVVGHSSGAHTVAMLALDERYLRRAGLPAGAVTGFVSLAGPVDTTWTAPDVQRLMGPRDGWPATYPYNFVDGTDPPLLLLHGASDDVVTVGNSVRLAEKITSRGGCVRLGVYKGVGHIEIVLALAFPSLGLAPAMRDVGEFVRDPVAYACADRAAAVVR